MATCKNCGVVLDEHMNFCPLCGVPTLNENTEERERLIQEKKVVSRKLKDEIEMLDRAQKRKFLWEVVSIILASGTLSTLVLNYIVSGSFTWSFYVLIGSLTIFFYVTVFSFAKSNLLTVSSALFIITTLSMLALDLQDNAIYWSVRLGVPLFIAGWLVLILLVGIIRRAREKGFNLVAYIFLALAALSTAVEGIVSLYLDDEFRLSWSAIVFFSILPVAAILLYIHYKLRRGTDLRKFFHI